LNNADPSRLDRIEAATADLTEKVAELVDVLRQSQIGREVLQHTIAQAVLAETRRTEARLRRRGQIVMAAIVLIASLGAVGAYFLHDISGRFGRQSAQLVANCQVGRERTQAQLDLQRAYLASDEAALAALTGPRTQDETKAFGHLIYDGRIKAERAYLDQVPKGLTNCGAYR
jgi:hypothetical protein